MRRFCLLFDMLLFVVCAPAQVPTESLTASYYFNGNANDGSGNGYNGTVTGATLVEDRFGNPNSAYSFNGSSNRIIVPHAAGIDMGSSDNFSIAFWMKAGAGNSAAAAVLSKSTPGTLKGYSFFGNNTSPDFCTTPGQFSFFTATNALGDACADAPLYNDNTNWNFIVGMFDYTKNESTLYVNGVLQTDKGNKAALGVMSSTVALCFGANPAGTHFFNGSIDDIKIYKRLLTPNEVFSLMGESTPLYYAELKKEYDAGYHLVKYRTLRFKYLEEYNNDKLDFAVYNYRQQAVTTVPALLLKKEGDNRFSLTLPATLASGMYYLEVKNGKGETQYLKFKL